MAILDEVNKHNHQLTDTSNVLMYLLKQREMCDNETCIYLLFRFLDQIDNHFKLIDSLYQGLLADKNQEANNTAEKFMSGEVELKRIVSQYTSSWCNMNKKQLKIKDYEAFSKDTFKLFEIMLARIQDETEHMYPMVREVHKSAA